MKLDRWVIPPAVVAALFSVVAVAPPVGPPGRGLRVEVAGEARPGRALLVRASVEEASDGAMRAPGGLRWWLSDGAGRVVAEARGEGVEGAALRFGVLRVEGEGPYTLRAEGEGLSAVVRLRRGADGVRGAAVEPDEGSEPEEPGAVVTTAIEDRVIVPEVPGTVLVRAEGATAVSLDAETEGLVVNPARAETDGCGVAAFGATLSGLDARVAIRTEGLNPVTTRRRLPVRAGGVSVGNEGERFVVRASLAGPVCWWMAGDASGAVWWGAARFEDREGVATARVPWPSGARWALASLGPGFEGANGAWREAPGALPPCATTERSRRWFASRARLPSRPVVALAFDGAARARERRARAVDGARRVAVGCLLLAVLLEAAMVLGAGFSRGPAGLEAVSNPVRVRAGVVLAGVALLALAGGALLVNVLLHAE